MGCSAFDKEEKRFSMVIYSMNQKTCIFQKLLYDSTLYDSTY